MTQISQEAYELMAKHVGNGGSAVSAIQEALDEREALKAEVERCHKRLEIDGYWISRPENRSPTRVEIPFEERAEKGWPDGIECRDDTIKLLEQSNASLRLRIKALEEALEGVHKFSLVIDSAVRNYDPRSIASGQYAEVAAVLKQVRDLRRAAEAAGGGE